ncbi:MAG: PDZ domain-containing protein [Limisphaerales bacterium]
MIRTILILAMAVTALNSARAADKGFEELWERAVVSIEVTRKQYEYLQPWSRRVDQLQKMGTIIGEREILTTADNFSSHTLVRLQKGRGRWFEGELVWIDYHANLAIVSCKEDQFWEGTKKVDLAKITPRRGTAQVVRWRSGILEFRNVDINRLTVKRGKLTFVDSLQLELDSEMSGIGWAEAIVQDDQLIALASSKDDQTITGIPSTFIQNCLADRKDGTYQGIGYFSFVWQTAENPDTLSYLGMDGEPRGVVVIEVPTNRVASPMKPRDIILEIDGFEIDVQGDYKDPDYGNLLLENLATREKRAGDKVKIKVMRAGKEMNIDYVLPKVDYTLEIVPMNVFDQDPEYLIIGGLLFQPLTVPYLQSWGADWSRKAPFRLVYATREDPTAEKPSYVVLSLVLPDPYNIGYQESRYLIVEKLNGKRISTLHDVILAKETPQDGFHVLEFREGDALRRMVLDAAQIEETTQRVLERYGIDKDRYLAVPTPGRSDKLAKD